MTSKANDGTAGKANQPLTTERRAEIEREMAQEIIYADWGDLYDFVHDLLSAERYWREAVRDASGFVDTIGGSPICAFCEAEEFDAKGHASTCPWLNAQERKEATP